MTLLIQKTFNRPILFLITVTAAILILSSVRADAGWTIPQMIQLKAGWNSVFLTVEPVDAKPDAVFGGHPVDKVLTYYPRTTSVQFIQDPDEVPFNDPGWHRWFRQGTEEAFLNNLFALQANQGYLIHCTQDVQLEVNGIPIFRSMKWQPDSFNFTGFHVNPAAPPTFEKYLGGAAAFSDGYIYYLKNDQWTLADKADPIAPGRAYWIFCDGGTEFRGIPEIDLPAPGDSLTYIPSAVELSIKVTNRASAPISFQVEAVPNAAGDPDVPLSLVTFAPETGKVYTPFTAYSSETPLEPGKTETIRLAVRRAELSAGPVKSLLKITDSTIGGMYYIPVMAETGGGFSGLWIGEIEVDKVNEVASKIDTSTVKDVKNPFDLRIILHSDGAGQVRMLRAVTLMQKRYTVTENDETKEMVRRALITDDTRLPEYEGVVRRDGKLTGIRLASTTFDFDPALNELPLSGSIEPSKTVSGTLTLGKDHPSNPFRHKYHPDHQNDGDTGVEVIRNITLTFDEFPENGSPEDGVSKLKGVYQEEIGGLHKVPIKLDGTFILDRMSSIDILNE